MSRSRAIGRASLWLSVACAVLAGFALQVTCASAAEPAFYECAKAEKVEGHDTGRYTSKQCGEESPIHEGAYEAREGVGKEKSFKSSGGPVQWEVKGVGGVDCSASKLDWKVTGPKRLSGLTYILSGCEVAHRTCESEGAALGEIKTNALRGEVGYLEGRGAKHEVGIALGAEEAEGYVAEFHCAEVEYRWSGIFIGQVVSETNVFTKELALLFQQSSGEQRLRQLEGGTEEVLYAELDVGAGWGEPSETGWSAEFAGKGETLELKA